MRQETIDDKQTSWDQTGRELWLLKDPWVLNAWRSRPNGLETEERKILNNIGKIYWEQEESLDISSFNADIAFNVPLSFIKLIAPRVKRLTLPDFSHTKSNAFPNWLREFHELEKIEIPNYSKRSLDLSVINLTRNFVEVFVGGTSIQSIKAPYKAQVFAPGATHNQRVIVHRWSEDKEIDIEPAMGHAYRVVAPNQILLKNSMNNNAPERFANGDKIFCRHRTILKALHRQARHAEENSHTDSLEPLPENNSVQEDPDNFSSADSGLPLSSNSTEVFQNRSYKALRIEDPTRNTPSELTRFIQNQLITQVSDHYLVSHDHLGDACSEISKKIELNSEKLFFFCTVSHALLLTLNRRKTRVGDERYTVTLSDPNTKKEYMRFSTNSSDGLKVLTIKFLMSLEHIHALYNGIGCTYLMGFPNGLYKCKDKESIKQLFEKEDRHRKVKEYLSKESSVEAGRVHYAIIVKAPIKYDLNNLKSHAFQSGDFYQRNSYYSELTQRMLSNNLSNNNIQTYLNLQNENGESIFETAWSMGRKEACKQHGRAVLCAYSKGLITDIHLVSLTPTKQWLEEHMPLELQHAEIKYRRNENFERNTQSALSTYEELICKGKDNYLVSHDQWNEAIYNIFQNMKKDSEETFIISGEYEEFLTLTFNRISSHHGNECFKLSLVEPTISWDYRPLEFSSMNMLKSIKINDFLGAFPIETWIGGIACTHWINVPKELLISRNTSSTHLGETRKVKEFLSEEPGVLESKFFLLIKASLPYDMNGLNKLLATAPLLIEHDGICLALELGNSDKLGRHYIILDEKIEDKTITSTQVIDRLILENKEGNSSFQIALDSGHIEACKQHGKSILLAYAHDILSDAQLKTFNPNEKWLKEHLPIESLAAQINRMLLAQKSRRKAEVSSLDKETPSPLALIFKDLKNFTKDLIRYSATSENRRQLILEQKDLLQNKLDKIKSILGDLKNETPNDIESNECNSTARQIRVFNLRDLCHEVQFILYGRAVGKTESSTLITRTKNKPITR